MESLASFQNPRIDPLELISQEFLKREHERFQRRSIQREYPTTITKKISQKKNKIMRQKTTRYMRGFVILLYRCKSCIVSYLDRNLIHLIYEGLGLISWITISCKNLAERYSIKKGYKKEVQFEKKYSDIDLAYMALGLGGRGETIKKIQELYQISYHYAMLVKKLNKNRLKTLETIREHERNISL